jgi:hypothetical protein
LEQRRRKLQAPKPKLQGNTDHQPNWRTTWYWPLGYSLELGDWGLVLPRRVAFNMHVGFVPTVNGPADSESGAVLHAPHLLI